MEKLLIYLDIDGVLNNNNWELKVFEEKGYYPIDRNELSKVFLTVLSLNAKPHIIMTWLAVSLFMLSNNQVLFH